MQAKKKIIIGLSGGVDSAVAAFLLKEQGHRVEACYMQNWMGDKDDPFCRAEQDLMDAKKVCDHLDIPFHLVNFSTEYWNAVFQYCLDEFVAGRTPNPDIWCNQYIKFDVFLKHAMSLGGSHLATGHYARNVENSGHHALATASDKKKDQTYFLYTLTQAKLSQSLFPLGEICKPEVRTIAKKIGLTIADKKDSTGICFIGERKFKDFLKNYVLAKPGVIKSIDGKIIGNHDGLMFYTLGQRRGIGVGGTRPNESATSTEHAPWYVIAKNIPTNELIVAQGEMHPRLFSDTLDCEKLTWVSGQAPSSLNCQAKIRYRQESQTCSITQLAADRYQVCFKKAQRAITPGQSVVFYNNDICLGGGIIL